MAGLIDEHVLGLDILVYQTTLMNVAESRPEAQGDAQKSIEVEWPFLFKNEVERLTSRVRYYEDCPPVLVSQEREAS